LAVDSNGEPVVFRLRDLAESNGEPAVFRLQDLADERWVRRGVCRPSLFVGGRERYDGDVSFV